MKYFVYCRKSSEDKQRQVLSIQSQLREVQKAFTTKEGIEIVEVFEEERSAMKPGRPIFGQMMMRIEAGEAEGIIAWAPDRIARNSVDGGRVIYLLDCEVLRDLKFLTYTFENNSQGKFMLQIMFGQSKYYSDALSENVRRGNRTKVEMGWRPSQLPLGYINDPETKTARRDPDRFPLIRKMWEMMLSGAYNPSQIQERANLEWGFRTPSKGKRRGGPIQTSTMYRMLSNEFYAGLIRWEGKLYPGKHEPVVSIDEFEQVQRLLKKREKARVRAAGFTYGGMIQCGSCNHQVTAENKTNRYGTRYTYYHCAHRSRGGCSERSISLPILDEQIIQFLQTLTIPEHIAKSLLRMLSEADRENGEAVKVKLRLLESEASAIEKKKHALLDMRLSELIDDSEYTYQRDELEKAAIKASRSLSEPDLHEGAFEPGLAIISFNKYAVKWFREGDAEDRRLILKTGCSNLILTGKILSIEAAKPLVQMRKASAFSDWRAFMEAIGNMDGLSAPSSFFEAIATLQKRAEARALVSGEKYEEAA